MGDITGGVTPPGGSSGGGTLSSVGLTSPDLTIGNSPLVANGALTVAIPTNANNGKKITFIPQAVTGVNAQNANWLVDTQSSPFTGNLFNDPVMAIGYNVDATAGIASTALDKFATGVFLEANYEFSTVTGAATAGTTTTVLSDSGKAFAVNQYVGWTLYNVTRALSQKITANTATTITSAAIAGQVSGDSYQILRDDMETYFQWIQNSGLYRSIRPVFISFDRGSSAAQGVLGTNGAVTISAATATNPIVMTTSVNHGLATNDYVKFAALAGGTWNTLNTVQLAVTVTSATTFSIAVDGTGFGAYTASSGTETAEPKVTASFHMVSAANGLQFFLPSWNKTGTDQIGSWNAAQLVINAFPYKSSILQVQCPTGFGTSIQMQYNAFAECLIGPTSASSFAITLYDAAGANGVSSINLYRTPNGGNAGGSLAVGNVADNGAVIGAYNNGGNSNNVKGLVIRGHASQAADLFEVQTSGSVVTSFIDQLFNVVTYGAQTAPATTDTNGFLYISKVAGAPTGVPANLAGNYANALPMRYDTTNHKLWVYDAGWKGVVLA
jgi:hypothetical protein